MSKLLKLLTIVSFVGIFTAACAQDKKMAHNSMPAEKDIVVTAVEADDFNTLVAAVKAAGLVETLQSPGPFTVFAPTDAAFAKLPAGTVENLLKPENKAKLVQILTYHVVSGEVPASAVVGKIVEADSVEGSKIMIDGMDGVILNGSAKVITADVKASNGVIHVIDTVIMPPKM
ncbi:fasciclin domain-containing protein [Sneathiella sp. HT1-7]|jgi:uncharacterized surface protein with fasciclin (FAS1) repeats|uniref:fasciclin domain-containing protein n=1 Tax=Sneathiella sp. HT1-7 TaxID=2887192 RepID=UPI001D15E116|nr:fasciclin domain-containing protein [Sneathiella sp. HT1-7]MCC3305995.1 fasciclin domain-containing protein [Sneathiella sp. HT1-7]